MRNNAKTVSLLMEYKNSTCAVHCSSISGNVITETTFTGMKKSVRSDYLSYIRHAIENQGFSFGCSRTHFDFEFKKSISKFDKKIALVMAIAYLESTNQIPSYCPGQTLNVSDKLMLDGTTYDIHALKELKDKNSNFFV